MKDASRRLPLYFELANKDLALQMAEKPEWPNSA